MTTFERYRLMIGAWFAFAACGGAAFGVAVMGGQNAVTPEIYGPWVYDIPPYMWFGAQFGSGALGALGVAMRWPWAAAAGGAALTLNMAFLAAAGSLAGASGAVLYLNAAAWIGPFSALATGLCLGGRNG